MIVDRITTECLYPNLIRCIYPSPTGSEESFAEYCYVIERNGILSERNQIKKQTKEQHTKHLQSLNRKRW